MTDDGPQPPIMQLAIAAHDGPAARAWCGPLPLVLLGEVVTFAFLVCMLSSVWCLQRTKRAGCNGS